MTWGATSKDWQHFAALAPADLLPVVANPGAEISPLSRMRDKGKTPSRYNAAGQVSGFAQWTQHEASASELKAWAKQPDYGVCVQTRRIRGLDVDVPDAALAARILSDFEEELCELLPVRTRANSGKRLAAFILPGDLGKRAFTVKEWTEWDEAKGKEVTKRWIVELLATGQQFVAAGTHPSGARYEWLSGLPSPPEVAQADFERAWAFLVGKYAIAPEQRVEHRERHRGDDLEVDDPVAAHLVEHWETYGTERGKLLVACPWKDGHSSDSGESEAAWLLAGSNGYDRGHFECRHAGCQDKGDGQFFEAVGYQLAKPDDFEDLTLDDPVSAYLALSSGGGPKVKAGAEHRAGSLPLPGFIRDKSGRIETTVDNVSRALRSAEACRFDLAFDEFRGELMISAPGEGAWRSLADADAVRLRIELETGLQFKDKVGKELMRDALELVGDERRFDSAIEWLTTVVPVWDGVPRIDRFFPDYFGVEDKPYTEAVSRYAWTTLAGRVLQPGIKADMVPVLVGAQGARKSSGIMAMSPSEEFYAEFDLEARDDDNSRQMRGTLVGELPELRGLNGRDSESIKAWIARRFEKWTPKYKEYATSLPRRLLFIGSTNEDDFLNDPTGERRWLPMVVSGVVQVERIEADRLQLWAEARQAFLTGGIAWAEAERLARNEHHRFKHVDPWYEQVARWLDTPDDIGGETPRESGKLMTNDVLVNCIGLDAARIQRKDQMRAAGVLKACGMEKAQKRVFGPVPTSSKQVGTGNGVVLRVWVDALFGGLV